MKISDFRPEVKNPVSRGVSRVRRQSRPFRRKEEALPGALKKTPRLRCFVVRPQGFVGSPAGCRNREFAASCLHAKSCRAQIRVSRGVSRVRRQSRPFRRKEEALPGALKKTPRLRCFVVRPQGFVGSPAGCRNREFAASCLHAKSCRAQIRVSRGVSRVRRQSRPFRRKEEALPGALKKHRVCGVLWCALRDSNPGPTD